MLREIKYTASPNSIAPYSPQFGGIQGEDSATKIKITFDSEFIALLDSLSSVYDNVVYRLDCVDGAGRYIPGMAKDLNTAQLIEFNLTKNYTESGGRLKAVLVISGINNDDSQSNVQLYTYPLEIYFKEFPISGKFSVASDLNKIIIQANEIRSDTYSIALSVISEKKQFENLKNEFNTLSQAALNEISVISNTVEAAKVTSEQMASEAITAAQTAQTASISADASSQSASISSEAAQNAKQSASISAQSALAYSQSSEQKATAAAGSADTAAASAESASQSAQSVLNIVGEINAILATIVTGGV